MLDFDSSLAGNSVLIGKGGFASVYKITQGGKELALKQMDIQLNGISETTKLINLFKKVYRELGII